MTDWRSLSPEEQLKRTLESKRWWDLSLEQRLGETKFIVEANDAEVHFLWKYSASESDKHEGSGVLWEQVNPGLMRTLGDLDGRPVCLSVNWNRINGSLVAFYHCTSQVADYEMIRVFLDKHFKQTYGGGRRARTDAMNFHICVQGLAELDGGPS